MPDAYDIKIKRSAEKEIRDLDSATLKRVVSAIQGLAQDPRPNGSQKLVGSDAHRLRVGTYRILYTIDDEARVVEVLAVGHRRDVCKKN